MKLNKTLLFFSFIILLLIMGIIYIHEIGLDDPLIELIDEETPGTYQNFFNEALKLLIYILVLFILLFLWNSIIENIGPRLTKTAINTLRVLGRMIIIPFCIIAYLNTFSQFQGTLLGISAILGTAIGFASTTTIGNFLAGLYIMAARPFLIGDYIILPDAKGIEGRVKEITVNYTKITLPTGNTVLVGNSRFLGQSIINTRTTEDHLILKKDSQRRFVYPLTWGTNSDDRYNWLVEAINKTNEEFNKRVTEPITWFIVSRGRLDTFCQINLTTDSATKLLDLTGDFMTALTANYDIVREKYKSQTNL